MRAAHRRGRTVTLRLRFADMVAITRARTLVHASDATEVLAGAAVELLREQAEEVQSRGCSLVGLSVGDLTDTGNVDDTAQLTLPFGSKARDGLDAALDELRERFGTTAIQRGSLLGRDRGFEMPKLPD
jgi:DNA polymerase-4